MPNRRNCQTKDSQEKDLYGRAAKLDHKNHKKEEGETEARYCQEPDCAEQSGDITNQERGRDRTKTSRVRRAEYKKTAYRSDQGRQSGTEKDNDLGLEEDRMSKRAGQTPGA